MEPSSKPSRDPANSTQPQMMAIWMAQLAAPVIFAAVAAMRPAMEAKPLGSIEQVLTFAALVFTALSWFLPKLMGRLVLKRVKEPIRDPLVLLRMAFPAFLVRWALLESLSILALVLVYMGNPLQRALPLFVVSMGGILANRPTPERAKSFFV